MTEKLQNYEYYDALTPLCDASEILASMMVKLEPLPMTDVTMVAYKEARRKVWEARSAVWWLRRVCDQHAG